MAVIHHELTAADGAAMAFLRVLLAANPAPITRASFDGLFEQVSDAERAAVLGGSALKLPPRIEQRRMSR